MAASYSPRVRHFELKFQSFADEGFPRDHASETQKLEWNLELGDYNLYSQGFSVRCTVNNRKKIHFFVVGKDIACVQMPSPLKKGGGEDNLSPRFFLGRGGRLYTTIQLY